MQTLVMVIQQSGESTHEEEELVFFFFMQLLHNGLQAAEDHYRYMYERWPRALFALVFHGLFLSEIKLKLAQKSRDRELCIQEAERIFRRACQLLDEKGFLSPSL